MIPTTACWRLRAHHKQVDLQGVLMMFNTYFKQEIIWYLKKKQTILSSTRLFTKQMVTNTKVCLKQLKNIKRCFGKSIFKLLVQNYYSLLNNKSKLSFTLCVTIKQKHRVLPSLHGGEHEGTGACDQHCYLHHH